MRERRARRQDNLVPRSRLTTLAVMPSRFPPCAYLPPTPAQMDARALTVHRDKRDADFYLSALTYGHYLWQHGQAARAILKVDRALLADLRGDEPVLRDWPLPYAAMAWLLRQSPVDVFIGNPRVHFSHLADRMNEPRREQRRWRAWACWGLARVVLPHLPGDPQHHVDEPTSDLISQQLSEHGLPGEAGLWRSVMEKTGGWPETNFSSSPHF